MTKACSHNPACATDVECAPDPPVQPRHVAPVKPPATLLDRRRLCDHKGSGAGPCGRCGASVQRKQLDLAVAWTEVAIGALRHAAENYRASGTLVMLAVTAGMLERVRNERHALALLRIQIDGFDWHAARIALDRTRARRVVLAAAEEEIRRAPWNAREPNPWGKRRDWEENEQGLQESSLTPP